MVSWWKPLAFGLVFCIVAHLVTIMLLPNIIMNVALKRISDNAGGVNKLFHSALVTPQTQTIVRSSPDLAYSTCALDLTNGPVEVFIGKGADYASVALYAANTDNVFALNDRKMGPQGARLMIVSPHMPHTAAPGVQVVGLPSNRGLILVRRLAPSAADYARVVTEQAGDSCKQVLGF
jgi:uncharacterized membrane protein